MANRFSQLGLSEWETDMLNDAYQAISVTGNWDNMKHFTGNSFAFDSAPWIINVAAAMQYRDSHSGTSFGLTMRTMEKIAKEGWESYVTSHPK